MENSLVTRKNVVALAGFFANLLASSDAGADSTIKNPVILLVPGMSWELKADSGADGNSMSGSWLSLVNYLKHEGNSFGGVIRPAGVNIRLPNCLHETDKTVADPRNARLFFLEFSTAANTDGLAFRAMELAQCLKELRRFTDRPIHIVAHSAGGLVARVVLQEACPGLTYAGGVERLITIGTPHLGAALATDFGDLLGTRATSLKPEAQLIQRLNRQLDLPLDCCYTAIMVRSCGIGNRGAGAAYDSLIDPAILTELPVDFREGGDQVVHVRSANLRWTECAKRWEKTTGRAVHGIVLRVAPEKGNQGVTPESTVHTTALRNATLQGWMSKLLADDGQFWTGLQGIRLHRWIAWQARCTVYGIIEDQALSQNRLRVVTSVSIEKVEAIRQEGDIHHFRFAGTVCSKDFLSHTSEISGMMLLTVDRFGRVVRSRYNLDKSNP